MAALAWAWHGWQWADFHVSVDDWPAWLTAIGTLLTMAILGLTALLARGALRDAGRTRHAQLLISLGDQWASEAVTDSFKLFGKYSDEGVSALIDRLFGLNAHEPSNDELDDYEKLTASANFIETIGVLREANAIPDDLVYKAWGGPIMEAWGAWHLAVPALRKLSGEGSDLFRYFENVSLEMKEIESQRVQRGQTTRLKATTASETASPVAERGERCTKTCVPHFSVSSSLGALVVVGLLSALLALFRRSCAR